MYPVSLEFKDRIKETNRLFDCQIEIQHEDGTLELDNEDLSIGSLVYNSATQSGEEFTIGGVVASNIELAIFNKPEYDSIDFSGAIIRVNVGLDISSEDSEDTYFLASEQPSEFSDDSEYDFEYIPLGVFIIDEDKRSNDVINIKAIDNMLKLGKDYSESTLQYPTTLLSIFQDICSHNDIVVGTVDFPNKNYTVQEKPTEKYTFRDILGYVAELSGSFARMNRQGALELRWYEDVGLEITPDHRYNFKASDEEIQITGIMFTEEDVGEEEGQIYLSGTREYAIDLSDNPLLQGNYEVVLPIVLGNVGNTVFRPYESEWQGDPSIDSGDMVVHETVDGEIINTIVTNTTFKYGGRSTLSAKGNTLKREFEGTTSKQLNNIVRRIRKQDREYNDKLTDLELAQKNAMELMANMLGGNLITDYETGNIYIANAKEIENSTEYWQWGLGGFVHYKDGVIDTGITADGSIVAMLVSAGIVNADYIINGKLDGRVVHISPETTWDVTEEYILEDYWEDTLQEIIDNFGG